MKLLSITLISLSFLELLVRTENPCSENNNTLTPFFIEPPTDIAEDGIAIPCLTGYKVTSTFKDKKLACISGDYFIVNSAGERQETITTICEVIPNHNACTANDSKLTALYIEPPTAIICTGVDIKCMTGYKVAETYKSHKLICSAPNYMLYNCTKYIALPEKDVCVAENLESYNASNGYLLKSFELWNVILFLVCLTVIKMFY